MPLLFKSLLFTIQVLGLTISPYSVDIRRTHAVPSIVSRNAKDDELTLGPLRKAGKRMCILVETNKELSEDDQSAIANEVRGCAASLGISVLTSEERSQQTKGWLIPTLYVNFYIDSRDSGLHYYYSHIQLERVVFDEDHDGKYTGLLHLYDDGELGSKGGDDWSAGVRHSVTSLLSEFSKLWKKAHGKAE